MTAAAAWRGAFIERLRATGNVTLAAAGAGVSRQHVLQGTQPEQGVPARMGRGASSRPWIYSKARPVGAPRASRKMSTTPAGSSGPVTSTDSALLMFLLKAHRPHKFRDNVKVEHAGGMEVAGDRKVTFEFVRPAEQQARTLAELAAEEAEEFAHRGGSMNQEGAPRSAARLAHARVSDLTESGRGSAEWR